MAAVGPDDPLAGRDRVSLAELAGRPLIALPEGTGLRAGIDTALRDLGLAPRIAYEAGTPAMLGELAVRGLGVALVPASVVPFVDGLVAIEPGGARAAGTGRSRLADGAAGGTGRTGAGGPRPGGSGEPG